MYAPPVPPVQKKSTPWGLIALILCGGFLLVGGLCAFGGYQFFKMATSKPQARKHFGEVREINSLSGGWKAFQFPDVPMRMELPSKPEKDTLIYKEGDAMYTREWIFYRVFSSYADYDLSGYWYRSKDLVDLDFEEDNAEQSAEGTLNGPSVNFTFKEAKRGKLSGREGIAEVTTNDRKLVVRCFIWTQNLSVFSVYCYADTGYEQESKAEFDRMLNSIQMD